jgi:uncharacterized protein YcgI (DUF1989 family)
MPVSSREAPMNVIEPRHGTSFLLNRGQRLKVTDLKGEQVSDFFAFLKNDPDDFLSSGRTLDYLSKIFVGLGDTLYSSKSVPIARIIEDDVGRHDFLLTPCSKDTFRIIYGDLDPHHGCEGNLLQAFKKMGIERTSLPVTFNIFMNVLIDADGNLTVAPPRSKAGNSIVLEALEDLVVGLTACSALQSNNGSFKPIAYEIL